MSPTNPTPWRLDNAGMIVDANGDMMLAEPDTRRRIVACINALEGVPIEAIEALKNDALEAARESFLRHRRPTGEPS